MGSAVGQARRGLIAAGFGADLCAAAATGPSLSGSTPEEQCALLAEIATYIDERDPLMIGAAWLLEQSGCERPQLSLLAEGPQTSTRLTPFPGGEIGLASVLTRKE